MMVAPMLFAGSTFAGDVELDEDVFIETDNARFSFNNMSFDTVIINNSFLQLDTLIFDIDTNNTVNISFVYINDRLHWANELDLIMEFVADCPTDEKVFFNISGLKSDVLYKINRNGSPIANLTTNSHGNLSFNNSDWSNKTFTVIQLDKINYNIRRVTTRLIDDFLPIFIVLAGVAGVIALYATNDVRVFLGVIIGMLLFVEALKIM